MVCQLPSFNKLKIISNQQNYWRRYDGDVLFVTMLKKENLK